MRIPNITVDGQAFDPQRYEASHVGKKGTPEHDYIVAWIKATHEAGCHIEKRGNGPWKIKPNHHR